MIQLDEHHWVKDADEVRAIQPVFISKPYSPDDPGRWNKILDPDKCMILIDDKWLIINRSTDHVAKCLEMGGNQKLTS